MFIITIAIFYEEKLNQSVTTSIFWSKQITINYTIIIIIMIIINDNPLLS